MFTLPQEFEVRYVIPAIRRELASCLTEHEGYTYEKVGELLGITKAAISQYIKKKRAAKIKLHESASKEVHKSCLLIRKGKSNATKEIMRILAFIKDKNLPSKILSTSKRSQLLGYEEIRINYNL